MRDTLLRKKILVLTTEACSTERVLASACQNSLSMQHKFWRTIAITRSAEHTLAKLKNKMINKM